MFIAWPGTSSDIGYSASMQRAVDVAPLAQPGHVGQHEVLHVHALGLAGKLREDVTEAPSTTM
jgi:hypothetical protein